MPVSEKRKVGGSTPPLTTRSAGVLTWVNVFWLLLGPASASAPYGQYVTAGCPALSHADRTLDVRTHLVLGGSEMHLGIGGPQVNGTMTLANRPAAWKPVWPH